jgi:hypothetical protein
MDGVRDGVRDRSCTREMKASADIAKGGRRDSESSTVGAGTTGAGGVGAGVIAAQPLVSLSEIHSSTNEPRDRDRSA